MGRRTNPLGLIRLVGFRRLPWVLERRGSAMYPTEHQQNSNAILQGVFLHYALLLLSSHNASKSYPVLCAKWTSLLWLPLSPYCLSQTLPALLGIAGYGLLESLLVEFP